MRVVYHEIKNEKMGALQNSYFLNRITEQNKDKDKLRTYISYIILKKLAKECGFDLDNINIIRDNNGKPHAKNHEFYFNISHSENIVVVAIDSQEIGVDIEKIRPLNLRVAKKFLNEKIEVITRSNTPDIEFTKQWTIFEARLKYWGNIELFRNNFEINTFSVHLADDNNLKYILTIASKQDISNITIEKF